MILHEGFGVNLAGPNAIVILCHTSLSNEELFVRCGRAKIFYVNLPLTSNTIHSGVVFSSSVNSSVTG